MAEKTAGDWRKRRFTIYIVVGVFVIISVAVAWNFYAVRTAAKWLVWSRGYKSEVLAQPASASGELKHIEWDGWGWGGQDTTVYLNFGSDRFALNRGQEPSTR